MTQPSHLTLAVLMILASYGACWMLQVSGGGGGGGEEAQAEGLGGDRAAVCYTQPNPHYHHQTVSLPLASAACSPSDASASYLPLSACQPCHTHCTCWHKVGSNTARAQWTVLVFIYM